MLRCLVAPEQTGNKTFAHEICKDMISLSCCYTVYTSSLTLARIGLYFFPSGRLNLSPPTLDYPLELSHSRSSWALEPRHAHSTFSPVQSRPPHSPPCVSTSPSLTLGPTLQSRIIHGPLKPLPRSRQSIISSSHQNMSSSSINWNLTIFIPRNIFRLINISHSLYTVFECFGFRSLFGHNGVFDGFCLSLEVI
jgi:hypothetical protein